MYLFFCTHSYFINIFGGHFHLIEDPGFAVNFFPYFRDIIPLSSGLLVLFDKLVVNIIIAVFENHLSLFFACFRHFLTGFGLCKVCYDAPWGGFLYSLLGFLSTWINVFHRFFIILSQYLFKCYFCIIMYLLSFWDFQLCVCKKFLLNLCLLCSFMHFLFLSLFIFQFGYFLLSYVPGY